MTNRSGARVQTLKAPGLPCPVCNTPIVVDPMLLLSAAPITCSACGLELKVNTERSAETLNALGTYMSAFNKAESRFAETVETMTPPEERGPRGRRAPRRRARRGKSSSE